MYNKELVADFLANICNTIETINIRTFDINCVEDFTNSTFGMIVLDSVCIKLMAIGESIKNIDKITNKELLTKYPRIDWKSVMGMRDIIVHHYFDIDAEEVFKTLKVDIPLLQEVISKIKNEL